MQISNFPKVKSPFIRKMINGRYILTPEVEPGYEWVFEDPSVKAVDKLHGTNVCVYFEDGMLTGVTNRRNIIVDGCVIREDMNMQEARVYSGVLHCLERGWLKGLDGNIFGELIAPNINGNIHGVARPLFVPFSYMRSKCYWKSWSHGDYVKSFNSISEWFRNIHSLFALRVKSTSYRGSIYGEGLVFTHQDGRMAKIRRDMFDWYEGEGHE